MNWWVVCRLTELTKKVEWIILEEITVVIAGGIYMGNKQQTPHWIPCPICNKKTEIKIYKDLDVDISDYDVLIIEDIFDSGRTLNLLVNELSKRNPRSLECCTLLDKPERRDPDITLNPKYVGKNVPDEFVVGYGLDMDEKYRQLDYIGILKPEVYM